MPPAVDAARRALAAALDTNPANDHPADGHPADGSYPEGWFDPDLLTVAEALAVLSDVTPPYPPLPERLDPIDPPTAIATALAQLAVALDQVSTVQDLTRIGLTALVLRRGGGVVA